jgi:hypothetical protein
VNRARQNSSAATTPPSPPRSPPPKADCCGCCSNTSAAKISLGYGTRRAATIEVKFGDMPTKVLAHPRARGVFMDWRDELALKSLRGADYTWTMLAAVLAWAKDRGKIPVNPCERGGRLYRGTRVDHVWSIEQEEAFLPRRRRIFTSRCC